MEGTPLDLTDKLTTYMRSSFIQQGGFAGDPELLNIGYGHLPDRVLPAAELPTRLICEADHVLEVLLEASRNRVIIYDFDPMGKAPALRHVRRTDFAASGERVESPTLFINESGYVLAWYLPRAVSMVNQARIWEALELLKTPLERSLARGGRTGTSWRTNEEFFCEGAACKGTIDLSPGWFPQGHSHESAPLRMAKILRPGQPDSESIRAWLKEMAGISAIMSAAMSIMHPDMHLRAREVMNRMWKQAVDENDTDTSDILRLWPSVFNVLSVMVNRSSPLHLDKGGAPQFFDQLLTVGHYECVDMYMPCFKRILSYPPGSMLAFSGQRVIHGVPIMQKDRACFAWYMRERIHQGMNVQRSDFPHIDDLPGPTLCAGSALDCV